jgi:hypothetical protein
MGTKRKHLQFLCLDVDFRGLTGTENPRVGAECGPVRFRLWAPFLSLNVNKHAVLTHFGITKAVYQAIFFYLRGSILHAN